MADDPSNGDAVKRKRSRNGCHRCKRLKVKCDEEKPSCSLCVKAKHECDYSIKLTWGGRPFKKQKSNNLAFGTVVSFDQKYNQDRESTSPGPGPAGPSGPSGPGGGHEGILQFDAPITLQNNPQQPKKRKSKTTATATAAPQSERSNSTNLSAPLLNHLPTPNNSVGYDSLAGSSAMSHHHQNHEQQQQPQQPPGLTYILNPPNGINQQQPTVPVGYGWNAGPVGFPITAESQSPHLGNELMAAFRELETSNTIAKEFLNNVLLPDFTSIQQGAILGSDEDSSPENLTFVDNFHSFPSFPPESAGSPSELFSNPLKFFTGFETIPEMISPLPDLLQQNPLYRQHYHSYIEVFSKTLVPAPPNGYKDNPFTCLLPQMSLSSGTDGILAVLICFGLCQSSSLSHISYPEAPIQNLVRRALNDLYKRLTDPIEANSDYTLALILVLSSFEILFGRTHAWRAHFFGAKNIMLSRGLLKAASKRYDVQSVRSALPVSLEIGSESDLSFFFTRWFAYLDVIGSLSSSTSIYETGRAGEFLWETPSPSRRDRERLKDIDPFMGFDLKLLEHFSFIIKLVKERESKYSSAETLSVNIIQQALEEKEELLRYLDQCDAERDQIEYELQHDPLNILNDSLSDYRVLRSTNQVFGLSGVLQIYRRVLMLPRDSPLVQDVVTRVTHSIAQYINKEQPAAYCTIFSLFSTGCEVLDEKTRGFFLDRVKSLADNGLFSAKVAHDIMLESWETGKYWADLIADRNIDIVFL